LPERADYTIIGDVVNIASRLESIARPNQTLIGGETYLLVKDMLDIKAVGYKDVKGKRTETILYELL
jgi:adenylate cyclase